MNPQKQLISETKVLISVSPGHVAKLDYKYRRYGVCNIYLAGEPLAEKRIIKVTQRKTKADLACFINEIVSRYNRTKKITGYG
jgi:hypothetical protein